MNSTFKSTLPLVLTPGDPLGVGPEITIKALQQLGEETVLPPILVIGASEGFQPWKSKVLIASDFDQFLVRAHATRKQKEKIHLLPAPRRRGNQKVLAGFQSGWSIDTAARLCLNGRAAAMVTGPISKENLQLGGYAYSGHTDFLEFLCNQQSLIQKKGGKKYQSTMMLANSRLKVSLCTVHVPISKVSTALNAKTLIHTFTNTYKALRNHWKIPRPRIAVLALNPHAGENGILGSEEKSIIKPSIMKLKRRFGLNVYIDGPFPADTFFAKPSELHHWDAVIAMYHDQGLIPVKSIDFANTVNVTLGLPLIRTSVDHGTAFDIAGKNIADPSSLKAAIELAIRMTRTQI